MEVMQVLHMNKGDGETSYAKNSTVQGKIISIAKPVTEQAIQEMLCAGVIPESIGIADLGCSSGPNAFLVISEIIDTIYTKYCNLGRPLPEFRVSLNDLPSNDFNEIFLTLPAFYNKLKAHKGASFPCYISAMPGSFYGRLFPNKSLHFVHSSSSLHWLSQVPPGLESNAKTVMNKGKVYISKSSPQCVLDAYAMQFQNDFSLFLKSRSGEIVGGGRMVLSFMGRSSVDPTTEDSCYQWELLAQALMSMVYEGMVEEEKVDSFNAPYYAPCAEELRLEIEKEGSFSVDRLERFEIEWDGGVDHDDDHHHENNNNNNNNNNNIIAGANATSFVTPTRGQRVAKTIRAVVESMLESHFGSHIMDDLFRRYSEIVDHYLSNNSITYINLVISVIRN